MLRGKHVYGYNRPVMWATICCYGPWNGLTLSALDLPVGSLTHTLFLSMGVRDASDYDSGNAPDGNGGGSSG